MERPKILVSEVLDAQALALLAEHAEVEAHETMPEADFRARLREFDAVIIRSAHRLTAEHFRLAPGLQVAARAGAGVDNIDLDAATAAGVLVLNTPGANAVAAAEHTFALLLGTVRRVCPSDLHVRAGGWRRQDYIGFELRGRRLGIIGIGRVGREVARIAHGFGMEVYAYDPYVDPTEIKRRGAVPCATLEELLQKADVLTVHTPKTGPRLGRAELSRLPQDAVVLNVARGGLIDEQALMDLLDEGHLKFGALDVFTHEPPRDERLLARDDLLFTCHLGGSTNEAMGKIGTRVVQLVLRALAGEVPEEAVNLALPQLDGLPSQQLIAAAGRAGGVLAALAKVDGPLVIAARGPLPEEALPIAARALIAGYLGVAADEPVNVVNALVQAQRQGIALELRREPEDDAPARIAAWFAGQPEKDVECAVADGRLLRLLGAPLDLPVQGHLLATRHRDLPGVVGRVGTLLGAAGVNIATLQLARCGGGQAVMALGLDDEPPAEARKAIAALAEVAEVFSVALEQSRSREAVKP